MNQIYDADEYYELIDRRLVRKLPSDLHSRVVRRISNYLFLFDPKEYLGTTWVFTPFKLDINLIIIPDIGFIKAERVPKISEELVKVVPDLIIQVFSLKELNNQANRSVAKNRIMKYLSYGVQIVWVINLHSKTVEVYHPDRVMPIQTLVNLTDELDGENVIPGFTLRLKELFG